MFKMLNSLVRFPELINKWIKWTFLIKKSRLNFAQKEIRKAISVINYVRIMLASIFQKNLFPNYYSS